MFGDDLLVDFGNQELEILWNLPQRLEIDKRKDLGLPKSAFIVFFGSTLAEVFFDVDFGVIIFWTSFYLTKYGIKYLKFSVDAEPIEYLTLIALIRHLWTTRAIKCPLFLHEGQNINDPLLTWFPWLFSLNQ